MADNKAAAAKAKPVKAKPFSLNDYPLPDYVQKRIEMFDRIKDRAVKPPADRIGAAITVTLPDGKQLPAKAYETTSFDIARGISKSLSESVIGAKVDGVMWDLGRPLEKDCQLELVKFDTAEGKKLFWHSAAHIMGQAMERVFGGALCIGPPLEAGGFYYDMACRPITEEDREIIEKVADAIIKEKQKYERVEVPKEVALEMFQYNKYKTEIIKSKVPDGETCTMYRCGPLIDLCRGPHVPDTGRIKAFAVVKSSSAYWLGNAENDSLQRLYGIAFPDKKLLAEWQFQQEEAAKRDHRKIGIQQELFFLNNQYSPGSPMFLPHGNRIYQKLVDLLRSEYRKRGFTEVQSPNLYDSALWECSGHWEHYKDDMFVLDVDKRKWACKPMNCPGHCLLFKHRVRSWRELPLRFAEFGVLHRNEASGALSGLTRVRRFVCDDCHIFARQDQIDQEVSGALQFMMAMYSIFGFTYSFELSTRPEKFLGSLEIWDRAEKALEDSLNKYCAGKWKLNPGDGAFYGPKIDVHVHDSLGRGWQCATIQLDFNLPERFDLSFQSREAGKIERPVIVHRAIYGSVERFMAILTEHFAGKWPFWLSPRQVMVVPVAPKYDDYAQHVVTTLYQAGIDAEGDFSDGTMPKKIAVAQSSQFNFILVVGEREVNDQSVAIRLRDESKGKEATAAAAAAAAPAAASADGAEAPAVAADAAAAAPPADAAADTKAELSSEAPPRQTMKLDEFVAYCLSLQAAHK